MASRTFAMDRRNPALDRLIPGRVSRIPATHRLHLSPAQIHSRKGQPSFVDAQPGSISRQPQSIATLRAPAAGFAKSRDRKSRIQRTLSGTLAGFCGFEMGGRGQSSPNLSLRHRLFLSHTKRARSRTRLRTTSNFYTGGHGRRDDRGYLMIGARCLLLLSIRARNA
jgi:hypothetical protein